MNGPYSDWPHDRVTVTGPDAVSFMQGQVSQDVAGLAVGASAWSFILEPTGKVCALFLATRVAEDSIACDIDSGYADVLVARINRFKIRIKADVVVESRGDVLTADSETRRIAAHWPAMGSELNDSVIPGETGMIEVTVSFTKGCYTGQELVARVDSRGGNVPRHLRYVEASSDLEPGTELLADSKKVGVVTSCVDGAGLAYLHRSVAMPAELATPAGTIVRAQEIAR